LRLLKVTNFRHFLSRSFSHLNNSIDLKEVLPLTHSHCYVLHKSHFFCFLNNHLHGFKTFHFLIYFNVSVSLLFSSLLLAFLNYSQTSRTRGLEKKLNDFIAFWVKMVSKLFSQSYRFRTSNTGTLITDFEIRNSFIRSCRLSHKRTLYFFAASFSDNFRLSSFSFIIKHVWKF